MIFMIKRPMRNPTIGEMTMGMMTDFSSADTVSLFNIKAPRNCFSWLEWVTMNGKYFGIMVTAETRYCR